MQILSAGSDGGTLLTKECNRRAQDLLEEGRLSGECPREAAAVELNLEDDMVW